MNELQRPIVPRKKAEHLLTLAVALLVMAGGLLAVAAAKQRPSGSVSPDAASAPAPTSAPPLAGRIILVDPGHGGYDGGARCRDSGIWEKTLNLTIALEVETALQQLGAEVVMTRRDDRALCSDSRPAGLTKKREDLQNRLALAKTHRADMLLSVHMNEYRVRSESGPQVFYRAGCDAGRLLAGCMQDALITGLSPEKARSAMAGDYFILQLDIPSVLIECGFVSNPREEKLLLDPAYQARIGEAVASGVQTYWRLSAGE